MVNIAEMEKITEAIIAARRALAEANMHVIAAKEHLKNAECVLIKEGIAGKNETERTANLKTATSLERENLAACEKIERAAILELEVCKDIRRCQENIIAIEIGKEA